jgi:hypothetical protein
MLTVKGKQHPTTTRLPETVATIHQEIKSNIHNTGGQKHNSKNKKIYIPNLQTL